MTRARRPAGLPDDGFSMQAAAIASALIERAEAPLYRSEIRAWLDRIESPVLCVADDMDQGRAFAEFLTDLARVGAGIPLPKG